MALKLSAQQNYDGDKYVNEYKSWHNSLTRLYTFEGRRKKHLSLRLARGRGGTWQKVVVVACN
jgi:hypothetical protein